MGPASHGGDGGLLRDGEDGRTELTVPLGQTEPGQERRTPGREPRSSIRAEAALKRALSAVRVQGSAARSVCPTERRRGFKAEEADCRDVTSRTRPPLTSLGSLDTGQLEWIPDKPRGSTGPEPELQLNQIKTVWVRTGSEILRVEDLKAEHQVHQNQNQIFWVSDNRIIF